MVDSSRGTRIAPYDGAIKSAARKSSREKSIMPAALISLMDAKERAGYAKLMAELVKLVRKNNEQISKMTALLEKLVKASGAAER
jgi:hypothetical protein